MQLNYILLHPDSRVIQIQTINFKSAANITVNNDAFFSDMTPILILSCKIENYGMGL